MPLSPQVSQEIKFLSGLNPDEHSITKVDDQLVTVERRSALCNFWHWFIYLITFTLVPRNGELDELTQEILKDLSDEIEKATTNEKDLAEHAVQMLSKVIANNGGSQAAKIDEMLATMEKVQGLPDVQKLGGSPAAKLKEEPSPSVKPKEVGKAAHPKADNTQLQKLIQETWLKIEAFYKKTEEESKKKGDDVDDEQTQAEYDRAVKEILNPIYEALTTIEDSVDLTKKELDLVVGCLQVDLQLFVKNLTPNLLTCLVKNALFLSGSGFIEIILAQLPMDKKFAPAFAKGFEPDQGAMKQSPKADEEQTPGKKTEFKDVLAAINAALDKFKDHLTDQEMKAFALHLCERTLQEPSIRIDYNFRIILDILDKLKPLNNDHTLLKALCQVEDIYSLRLIYLRTEETDFVTQEILTSNPLNQKDPDHFFDDLVRELHFLNHDKTMPIYESFVQYVLKHVSDKRKQQLVSNLQPKEMAENLEFIPTQSLKTLNDWALRDLCEKVRDAEKQKANPKGMKVFASALTAYQIARFTRDPSNCDFCAELLRLADRQTQVQYVNEALDAKQQDGRHEALEKANLAPAIWEEASKLNPAREYHAYVCPASPETLAAIVNGQIGNSEFLKIFFEDVYHAGEKADKRRACTAYLKPEVFIFEEPDTFRYKDWGQFTKTLREMDDRKKAEALLVTATINLFNSPGLDTDKVGKYLYMMSEQQLKSLPLDQFNKPEMQVLLAILTDQRDAGQLDTMKAIMEMNGQRFFEQFRPAFQEALWQDYAFTSNIKHLKTFLKWVLDEARQDTIKPIIDFIKSETYMVFNHDGIKDDPKMIALAARIGIEIDRL